MRIDLRTQIDINTSLSDFKESVRNRIKTANDTSSRARYSLIFLSLVSAGFIMSIFSYFYSWNKEFAFQYLKNSQPNQIRDGIITEWLSTQTYELPILGIKIMASDIQIFGPIVLLIVSTWNFYEVRREHYTIGRLLGDVHFLLNDLIKKRDGGAIIFCQEVYHNIIGYTVFNVIPYDKPILQLGEPLMSKPQIKSQPLQVKIRRVIVKLLVLTPLISISFILLTRILTFYVIKSPVTGEIHPFSKITDLRYFLIILSALLILFSAYICFLNMKKVFKLDGNTRRLLDHYQQWAFEVDEEQPDQN